MQREKLVKIGAKVVAHGSYITFQLYRSARSGCRNMHRNIISRQLLTVGANIPKSRALEGGEC